MWFYIMGLIYFIGAAAIAANSKPRILETLAAIYAALLIGIYFYMGSFDTIGYVDKAIEVILIVNFHAAVPTAETLTSKAVNEAKAALRRSSPRYGGIATGRHTLKGGTT